MSTVESSYCLCRDPSVLRVFNVFRQFPLGDKAIAISIEFIEVLASNLYCFQVSGQFGSRLFGLGNPIVPLAFSTICSITICFSLLY